MAFQLGDDDAGGISEINLIPLIDIMLVLMIIFLVTATVLNPSIPLNLPKTSAVVNKQPPKSIQISIDDEGKLFWDKRELTLNQLEANMANEKAALKADAPEPTVQIRADKEARYDTIAKVLATASKVGLTNIAFVSDAETS